MTVKWACTPKHIEEIAFIFPTYFGNERVLFTRNHFIYINFQRSYSQRGQSSVTGKAQKARDIPFDDIFHVFDEYGGLPCGHYKLLCKRQGVQMSKSPEQV